MIYSATFHENVSKLVLLEGFGPLTEIDVNMTTPHNLRRSIDAEISMKQRTKKLKYYKHLGDPT